MMYDNSQRPRSRYQLSYLSQFSISQLSIRNPYISAAWAFLTPGLANLLQDRKLKGLILIVWALFINKMANINLALFHTLLGRFDLARQAIDIRWLLLYIPVLIYAAWNGYRCTVEMNCLCLLAKRENAKITPFVIKTLDINYLDKRNPWVAAAWSAMMPGLGNLYLHKIVPGLFFVSWMIVLMYFSHGLEAVHYSLYGNFEMARHVIDMQWFLYVPAIYGFQIYHAYVSTVDLNKLFDMEQSQWLRQNFQQTQFPMPM